jgi:chromosome segregation ATPase
MTTQQQLDILRELDGDKSQQDEWRRQEKMYQLRRDLLNEEMKRIKDAYDRRMKMYEEEIEANERLIESKEKQAEVAVSAIDEQIKAIQRLMDLLDDEGEAEDREEAERQHNQKIADLIEERQYHEVRTGREHLERIDEINREIAEENRRWQLQQNDWAREDQKDAYQDQIDALREKQKAIEKSAREEINRLKDTNNRKKQEMQKYYNELQGILNESTLSMMATVDAAGGQFIERMRRIAQMATEAFGGGLDFERVIREALDMQEDVEREYRKLDPNEGRPSDSTGSGSYQYTKDSYQYTKEQAHAKAESARAQLRALGYSQGVADISSYDTYEGTLAWYNTYIRDRTDLTQHVKNLFKEIVDARKIWTELDKAHTGAYVAQSGVAELLKGERVLSPQMTLSFDRLSAVLGKMPDIPERIAVGSSLSDKAVDRLVKAIERRGGAQINGPVVNIEHAGFEGRYDGQALGVDIRNMITAKG